MALAMDGSVNAEVPHGECCPESGKKMKHVRFKDPSPRTDHEDASLLVQADPEEGHASGIRSCRREDDSGHIPQSLGSLVRGNLLLILLTFIFIVGTAYVCIADLFKRYSGR